MYNAVDCIVMSPFGGIYRSTRLGGQGTSPRDKKDYHGITSILNYHISSCLIYSNIPPAVVAVATRTVRLENNGDVSPLQLERRCESFDWRLMQMIAL